MKKIVMIFGMLLSSVSFSQTNYDVIVKHTGERLSVKIISIDEKIAFNYPNETANQTLAKIASDKLCLVRVECKIFPKK